MAVTALLVVAVTLLITYWIWQRKKQLKILKDLGVLHDKPNFFFGNILEFPTKGYNGCMEEWHQIYGKRFGYYEGARPIIVTAEIDILKQILVKDFPKFCDRKILPLDSDRDEYMSMFHAKGQQWRRIRGTVCPTFSGSRMREMSPLITKKVENLVGLLDKHARTGEAFDFYSEFGRYTLDVIAATAFGLDTNSIEDPNCIFLRKLKEIFAFTETASVWQKIGIVLYFICPEMIDALRMVKGDFLTLERSWFFNAAEVIMNDRAKSKNPRCDFIKLLIDASMNNVEDADLTANDDVSDEKPEAKIEHTKGATALNEVVVQEKTPSKTLENILKDSPKSGFVEEQIPNVCENNNTIAYPKKKYFANRNHENSDLADYQASSYLLEKNNNIDMLPNKNGFTSHSHKVSEGIEYICNRLEMNDVDLNTKVKGITDLEGLKSLHGKQLESEKLNEDAHQIEKSDQPEKSDKVDQQCASQRDTVKNDEDSSKKMTKEETAAQCLLFLLAGYETSSAALTFWAYDLALHPDAQKRLQEEVDQAFPEKTAPDYFSVQKLSYLSMAVNESLRLHSIAPIAFTRKCTEATRVGDLDLPEGIDIQVNMEAVHMDKDLWGPEETDLYVPERFLAERKMKRDPLAFLPFGAGPRNCIGMRFAMMEIKLAMARILQSYTILPCEETLIPLPTMKNTIKSPAEPVMLRLQPRN